MVEHWTRERWGYNLSPKRSPENEATLYVATFKNSFLIPVFCGAWWSAFSLLLPSSKVESERLADIGSFDLVARWPWARFSLNLIFPLCNRENSSVCCRGNKTVKVKCLAESAEHGKLSQPVISSACIRGGSVSQSTFFHYRPPKESFKIFLPHCPSSRHYWFIYFWLHWVFVAAIVGFL